MSQSTAIKNNNNLQKSNHTNRNTRSRNAPPPSPSKGRALRDETKTTWPETTVSN